MINFRYSPVDDINNRQRILRVPRLVKLKLKRYLYSSAKSNNTNNIILKRNYVKLSI